MFLTLLLFILVLSVLVLIHEFGHFIVAKKLGIKVEEFGFGFPPRVFGWKKGETIYSINLLPFGGFVKLLGEDEAGGGSIQVKSSKLKVQSENVRRAFFARSTGQRASVILAGVIMNVILAFVIFYLFMSISGFKTHVPLLTKYSFFFATQKNTNTNDKDLVVSAVLPNSPAGKVKINTPAEILSVNGKVVTDRIAFIDLVNKNKGKEIVLSWRELDTGKTVTTTITPRQNPPENEGPLGVGFFPIAFISYDTPIQKALSGIVHPTNMLFYTMDVFRDLIGISIKEKSAAPVSEGFSGPVGIYAVIDEILKVPDFKEKVLGILNIIGLMSVSLAFFNVLPIPALDGGRLFFILVEMVTRKKVSQKYESLAHAVGLVVLLSLILLITVKDLLQIFSGNRIILP